LSAMGQIARLLMIALDYAPIGFSTSTSVRNRNRSDFGNSIRHSSATPLKIFCEDRRVRRMTTVGAVDYGERRTEIEAVRGRG
jgi:hypothetical protein